MDVKDIAIIRIMRDVYQNADPNRVKRNSFINYIQENHPGCRIHTIFIPPHDEARTYEILEEFFREHPQVKHIAMPNSRVHLIADYLRRNPCADRHVVGFDDIAKNIEALNEGLVEYLVTRQIPKQSFHTISYLAEAVISENGQKQRDYYMHMDILHKLNSKHYEFKG